VFFTGFLHEEDLPDVYRSAHLFSLVSDRGFGRGEGIPLTPLEAAAVGVPILVGNQDGSQEAVVEGINGFILDPFDIPKNAEAIVTLMKNGALRGKMGRAARERIEKEFAYPKFVQKHRELLGRWFPDQLSKSPQ
jgi:phosphatidylinositol alpha-1,6-mannosyltransferase